jgi:hypothetical protein
MFDAALAALLDRLDRDVELAALTRHPYDQDPALMLPSRSTSPEGYVGDAPKRVVLVAKQRRSHRAAQTKL